VAFSPDGSLVAAGTGGGVIQVWRLPDGAPVEQLTVARAATWPFTRQRTEVDALRFGADGASLTAVSGASLTNWRLADRTAVASAVLSRPLVGSYWRYGATVSPDGALAVVATADQTIELVRLTDGVRAWSRPIETPVHALAWSEGDNPQIAVGLRSATIQVLRAHDGGLVRELRGHTEPPSGRSSNDGVQALAFSPDGSTLGSVADDGSVRLWRPTEGTGHVLIQGRNELTSIAWSPDGRIVAAGASEGHVVRAWHVADGTQLYEARGHRDWVVALAFSTDGGVLASASRDGTIRLMRAADGTALATLRLAE
jgi:WD40 repeat protein